MFVGSRNNSGFYVVEMGLVRRAKESQLGEITRR
jgi:hypothetical protein